MLTSILDWLFEVILDLLWDLFLLFREFFYIDRRTLTPDSQDGKDVYLKTPRLRWIGTLLIAMGLVSTLEGIVAIFDYEDALVLTSLWLGSALLILVGVHMMTGRVLTDKEGITRQKLWSSQSVRWNEVVAVERRGWTFNLFLQTPTRRLKVGLCYTPIDNLLREIHARTGLQVVEI